MLFCLEQLKLGGRKGHDGGEGTAALPFRGGRYTSVL